ncbi:MAG: hypothetical protein ACE5LU_21535 [Anaerolineae bacterium]
MFSRHVRRRLNQIISIILCVTILAQSSPLPAWPYLRSWSESRRPAAGARRAHAAEQTTAGIAPRALPTPSPAIPLASRATAEPGHDHSKGVAVEAAFRPPLPPQGAPRPQIQQATPPASLRQAIAPLAADIALVAGWNLISMPEELADTDPASVLSSIAGQYNLVYAYAGCDAADPWKLYDPAAPPPASDLTVIDHRIGFWIEMTAQATLSVDGTKPTSTSIQLCQGWNLIGYPMDKVLPVPVALAPIAGKYTLVFAWDPTDAVDPWEVYEVGVPDWSNDLQFMCRGGATGCWPPRT